MCAVHVQYIESTYRAMYKIVHVTCMWRAHDMVVDSKLKVIAKLSVWVKEIRLESDIQQLSFSLWSKVISKLKVGGHYHSPSL